VLCILSWDALTNYLLSNKAFYTNTRIHIHTHTTHTHTHTWKWRHSLSVWCVRHEPRNDTLLKSHIIFHAVTPDRSFLHGNKNFVIKIRIFSKVVVEFSWIGRHKAWQVVLSFVQSYTNVPILSNASLLSFLAITVFEQKTSEAISKHSNTLSLAEKTVVGSVKDGQSKDRQPSRLKTRVAIADPTETSSCMSTEIWVRYFTLCWTAFEMWWHTRIKPDFVFRRNGRVHLNQRGGRQFSRLLAAEVCASVVAMLDTPCSDVV
jgi:hypothetical protein